MPNKTIYIADSDLPTADRAAEIAGGLSPAVTQALREYVARHELLEHGFEEIHVSDRSGSQPSTRIFSGRQLAALSESTTGVRTVWRSYVTPKENIVVVRATQPDSVGYVFRRSGLGEAVEGVIDEGLRISGLRGGRGGRDRGHPGRGRGTGGRRPGSGNVFSDLVGDSVADGFQSVIGGLGGNLRDALEDIGEQIRNHDRSTERWMGGAGEQPGGRHRAEDQGASAPGGDGWSGEIIDHAALTEEDGANRAENSADGAGGVNKAHGSDKAEAAGRGAEAEGSSAKDAGASVNPSGAGTNSARGSSANAAGSTGTGEAEEDGASATLEVFASIDELKAAAFREGTGSHGAELTAIPTGFIRATEKALNTPPVEYLDI